MDKLKVTLVQTTLVWENISENIRHFETLLHNIGPTDLIVLPEMFTTGFTMNAGDMAEQPEGETHQWLSRMAIKKGSAIAGSIIVSEKGKYYNRLIFAEANGISHTYDKKHLFRMAGEHNYFQEGSERLVITLKGWRICPLICYDLRFPAWCRNINTEEGKKEHIYDVLLFVANWPERRRHPWQILLQARAIENQCYTIGVNRIGVDGNDMAYAGDSVVVDPYGNSLSKTLPHTESVETVELDYESLLSFRSQFPVIADADRFSLLK